MNITRIALAMSASLWLTTGIAGAEFIGLNIGNHSSQPAQSTGSSSFDLVDDLDVDNPAQRSMLLILEHPNAMLPNLRYQSYDLDSSDNTTINPKLNFSGSQPASVNDTGSSYDLAHDDIVLYYQLLNKWIDLDMGVDLKRFDGQVSQAGADNNVEINETIPLFHLSARVALPITGLYLGADINTHIIDVGLSKSSAQDSTLMMGYDTGNGLGITGGFKSFSLELNDSGAANTNLEYDGLFLNGYINF